jgi:dienelactone hydrolase
MRPLTWWSAIPLSALLVAPLATQPVPDWQSLGKTIVQQLAAHEFSKVAAQFDEAMLAALPEAKLATVWDQLTGQVGILRSITGTRVEEVKEYRHVFVTCQFEKALLDTKLVFDSKQRVAGLFFTPSQPPVAWTPPDYARPSAVHERAVTVGTAPWELEGTLTLPTGRGPFPAVVLVHGSGPQDEDETIGPNKPFRDLALGLAGRGIAVLRYVKRTAKYAGALRLESGEFTSQQETVDDARAAVAVAAHQPEVDPRRVYVLGHSWGGTMAPRIARGNSQVAGMIVMAGSTKPFEKSVVDELHYLARLDPKNVDPKLVAEAEEAARQVESPALSAKTMVKILGTSIPGSYFLDLRGYHPGEVAAQSGLPILILQGGRDYQVTDEDLAGWKAALAGRPRVTFKVYPGLFHLFMPSKSTGNGRGTPADYGQPSHVVEPVVADIAAWVSGPGAPQRP